MKKEKISTTRIGKQIKHFEQVDEKTLVAKFSECKRYRYNLCFEYLNTPVNSINSNEVTRNKTLAVILKNPSSADETMADNTIRRVQGYVYTNFSKVKKVYIINLFALRATDAKDVQCCCQQYGYEYIVGDENNMSINNILTRADYIITAWGGNSGIEKSIYNKRIEEVKVFLFNNKQNDAQVFRVNPSKGSEQYPNHACFWSYTYPFIEYKCKNAD